MREIYLWVQDTPEERIHEDDTKYYIVDYQVLWFSVTGIMKEKVFPTKDKALSFIKEIQGKIKRRGF